jgi:sec-independent protein translocase protein TatB
MFFDIGWPELMLIGVVALVVIGPKDLPAALRVAGFWVRKARMMSREFQSSVEQMIREAELDEMQKELKKATEFDLDREITKAVDPTGELAASIKPPDVPDYFEPLPSTSAVPSVVEPAAIAPPPGDGIAPSEPVAPPEPTVAPPAAEIAALETVHAIAAESDEVELPTVAPVPAAREPAPSKP